MSATRSFVRRLRTRPTEDAGTVPTWPRRSRCVSTLCGRPIPLVDFWPPNSGPERCHELKGDLAGVFSIDLKQPYRLLFRTDRGQPTDGPV